jgi:FdhD protein
VALSGQVEGKQMKSSEISFLQYSDGKWQQKTAQVPFEQAVTLIVNGKPWMEMLCTPAMISELAVGFLYNERLINSAQDITRVHVCDTADFVEVDTSSPISKPTTWIKTTGCGGGQTAQRLEQPEMPTLQEITLSFKMISNLLDEFVKSQDAQTSSRGVHCSAISDGENILKLADDIGRHNTLDKLMGFILLQEPSLKPSILLTTGRISSEMLQKTARMGVAVVISLTSPNTFTVQLAEDWGMTLIGYARGARFNVYSHPERFSDLS